jgi:hypothetical protein
LTSEFALLICLSFADPALVLVSRSPAASAGVSALYTGELVAGLTRVNYGQDVTMNALAGSIAMFPTLGGSDSLFAVEGGNSRVAKMLLQVHGEGAICPAV